jgi:hypothetical protein
MIVNDIPINFVPCLNCREMVDLSGSKLCKYDISSIRETINEVKMKLVEKRIRQECAQEMENRLQELSRKRQKTEYNDDDDDSEVEVARLFPLFEKLLYMRSPCCGLPYTSDGCEAILCDQCNSHFCGLCLEATFRGKDKSVECHNHAKTCVYNEHFKGDYYTRSFYSQYQQYRRFAQKWNDFVVAGDVSYSTIIALMSKLVPILQDTNLVFNDAGYVDLVFTNEQQVIMDAHEHPPPAAEQPRRRRREPRRYRCGFCRQEGHNQLRCPLRRQQEREDQQEEENGIVVENIFAPPPPHEVIHIE